MNYNELKTKSLSDDSFAKQMSYKLNDSDERASFFTWISKLGLHWQKKPTPFEIIRKMVSKTSLNDKNILVLFNIEFLHILIDEQGVNPQDITFIADNQIEKLCANKIFKVQSYWLSDYTVPDLKNLIIGLDMKFDLVFSNPPYTKSVDIKILTEVYDVADEIIIIHPSTWLLDTKGTYGVYKTFRNKIEGKSKSFEMFNGCNDFGIIVNSPIVISHIDKKYNGNINIDYFGESFTSTCLRDVTKFGQHWKTIVEPFYQKINKHIQQYTSVWDNKVDPNILDDNKKYCQLADIIGNINSTSKTSQMVKDDFYTLTIKNSKDNLGIRKNTIQNTYHFEDERQRASFLKYCETDFVRFCLALTKNNTHVDTGEMKNIPWLDFTESWDDEKLFKKFDVSQELQDYIREFLPDYYGIRN